MQAPEGKRPGTGFRSGARTLPVRESVAAGGVKRPGTPDDIAAAAAFLLGPDAAFVTGTDLLLVNGGVVAAFLGMAATASETH